MISLQKRKTTEVLAKYLNADHADLMISWYNHVSTNSNAHAEMLVGIRSSISVFRTSKRTNSFCIESVKFNYTVLEDPQREFVQDLSLLNHMVALAQARHLVLSKTSHFCAVTNSFSNHLPAYMLQICHAWTWQELELI